MAKKRIPEFSAKNYFCRAVIYNREMILVSFSLSPVGKEFLARHAL